MSAFEVLAWFMQYTCGLQDKGSQAEQTPGWRRGDTGKQRTSMEKTHWVEVEVRTVRTTMIQNDNTTVSNSFMNKDLTRAVG